MRREEVVAVMNARAAFACIGHIEEAFSNGNEAGAREALAHLAAVAVPAIPHLDAILAADLEAAEPGHLPQRPMRILCAIGVTQPHPHPANSHVATPTEPAPQSPDRDTPSRQY